MILVLKLLFATLALATVACGLPLKYRLSSAIAERSPYIEARSDILASSDSHVVDRAFDEDTSLVKRDPPECVYCKKPDIDHNLYLCKNGHPSHPECIDNRWAKLLASSKSIPSLAAVMCRNCEQAEHQRLEDAHIEQWEKAQTKNHKDILNGAHT
ncbi:hypothetical protein DACRYDRAFT_17958 [Dacryopinax primogenitus]|uniref:RING-type domain-containing protein n=1 Tax=Dacryopinax primogenitus (strain DJM 731) TaxID=1858805 RepID=M5FZ07_DACPD|nr:uncharacterized protein DACRYDRAFT_17958 [Dacryopinax primogenitus]EJT98811.1 hypothetical protein DACRYDRAFT_17958 [Dacryopinax primogenitus]